jgi:3-deoxy-D-manno-octulosonic-acid transferase
MIGHPLAAQQARGCFAYASGRTAPVNETRRESFSTTAAFLVYDLAVSTAVVFFLAPFALLKMIRTPAYRSGIGQRLSLQTGMAAKAEKAPVWIQAVSVGEVQSVAPLVEDLNSRTNLPVYLTTTTETGRRMADKLQGTINGTGYFPLDLGSIARRALSRVRPRLVVLFETEIWPNFIRAASSLRIPVAIINGRISEKSFRHYQLVPRIFGNAFSLVTYAGMQSHRDAERVLALGVKPEAVDVCGNMKFDSSPAPPSPDEIEELRAVLGLNQDSPLVVAGSTHEGEETAVIRAYQRVLRQSPQARLLIAPRHPERFDSVEASIRSAGLSVLRRSTCGSEAPSGTEAVILLDTIGELARVYALAYVAFVGGSLANIGGHNIVEPASMGKPVLFGPHMHHFEDIKDAFLSESAALCVNNEDELFRALSRLLDKPAVAESLGKAAMRVVEANRGATERYFAAIQEILERT